jgi:hypothetical protein
MRTLAAALLFLTATAAGAADGDSLFPSRTFGGCRIARGISEPVVAPALPCLNVIVQSCQYDAVIVANGCGEDGALGSLKLSVRRGDSLEAELFKDASGRADARTPGSSAYAPDSDEAVSVPGKVGVRLFTLSYVKRGARYPLGRKSLRHARFTAKQIESLFGTGPSGGSIGSETRQQIFYHYFRQDRDPELPAPAWLDASLESMRRHQVWNDPEEGPINEAQVWQAPAAVLYEFFELLRSTLRVDGDGGAAAPAFHFDSFEAERVRYGLAVDRLRLTKPGGSLGGRGRAVLADFLRIVPELKMMQDAAVSGDEPRYIAAVMSVGAHGNDALAELKKPSL